MKDAQTDLAVRQYVAGEVRAELARQRISVSEAARRLGWGQSVLQRRIVAERPFEAEELVKMARLLDVPVERFFPEVGFRTAPTSTPTSDRLGTAA